ncbi:MAG: glycoside hydrolase family 127 protein [Planctomycetes bacterium]|nr:glycoside hydrolase family 127 protein [Planctomycetota bacterium]
MNDLSFEIRSNYQLGISLIPWGASSYRRFPVRLSLPAPPCAHHPDQALELWAESGERVPSEIRPFILWPDGSVRAWEVWFPADLNLGEKKRYTLKPRSGEAERPSEPILFLSDPAHFSVSVLLSDGSRLAAEAGFSAGPRAAAPGRLATDEEQPVVLEREGKSWFRGAMIRRTWTFYPGMELSLRLMNSGPADSLSVREVRWEFDLPLGSPTRQMVQQLFHSADRSIPSARFVENDVSFVLRADAGGTRVTDIAALKDSVSNYPPYERPGAVAVSPWLAVGDASASWLLLVDEASERFPKGWRIEGRRAVVELHPLEAHPLGWRQGMSLFQRLHLVRFPPGLDGAALNTEAWAWQRPPLPRVDADRYRASGWRIPFRYEPERFPRTENVLRTAFSFSWYRGTFWWGDESDDMSLAEHLALPPDQRHRARPRNGEYDITGASAKEFARTGRGEFLRMCRNAAEHLLYTDFVGVSDDPWKEGGVPAHCREHTRGAAYPSHIWTEGLTLYYQLTGDRRALEVACRIGDFILKYLHERFPIVTATAREGGWSLIALSALYDLTREDRYLDGIRLIVDAYLNLAPDRFFPENGSFMVGIGLVGIDRARPFYRGGDIRKFIPSVLDWQIENRRTGEGLFDFHYDSEKEGACHIQVGMPEALDIGYRLTGNERYLRVAFRQFQFWQAGTLFHVVGSEDSKDSRVAAATQFTWMGCLESFAEKGWLDRMQF